MALVANTSTFRAAAQRASQATRLAFEDKLIDVFGACVEDKKML